MLSILDHVITEPVVNFLTASNALEDEYSLNAFIDAVLAWNYALTDHCYVKKRENHRMNTIHHPILEIHRRLMRRPAPSIAGKVRNCAVTIGGKLCPFTSTVQIEQDLTAWYGKYALAGTREKIKEAHIAFEHLHPFEDGNGRVGRILMNVQRVYARLPLLVIKPGAEQAEYYKWF